MADQIKKQFFRVKELANQSLFRGEKTEVLTESLLLAERRIDALQKACSVSARKILSCLAGHGTDATTVEKRSKKIPEIVLGNVMLESSTPFGETSVLGRVLHDVGSLESELGYELLQYELKVEQIVAARLQQVESEVASVVKNRRNLNKLTLEMDASRKAYQSNRVSVGNNKSDQLREEMEDAYQKVELSRDALATEIYTLIAREPEFAETILQYAQLKRDYHKSALQLLETNIPKLELIISENPSRPAFGTKLEVHLESCGRTIAYPIELCVCALLEVGLEEEGLFRVAGGSSKVRKLKAAFDAGYAELGAVVEDCRDPHAISSVLKCYLRELPEPILTHELYDDWIAAVRAGDLETRLQAMKQVIGKMPESRFANLRYLVRFLAEIVKYQESNKMTPSNLAIVIAPNLIWSPAEDSKSALGLNMSLANTYSLIVENLITHCDYFFPGCADMDFYMTCSKLVLDQPSPKAQKTNTRISAPEYTQEPAPPLSKTHRRIGSLDGILSFANGNESASPSSPKLPVRRKNKPAPVPPTPPKTVEPSTPTPELKPLQESEKSRPPLPPPPSERTATLPRLKEQKAKKEMDREKSKEDLLAEIEKEMNRKQEEEAQKVQADEEKKEEETEAEVLKREVLPLTRAASIRNRAALFERPPEDNRMSKSVGNLAGESSDSSVVQRRLTLLEGQQVAPIRMPVPAERKIPTGVPSSPGPVVSEARKSLEKYATTVEVEKSKPIIPERPVALPRVERKNSVNTELGKAILEKTHVYSVDKQQASLVQVQPHDTLSRKGSSSSFNIQDSNKQDKGGSSPVQERPSDRSSISVACEPSSFQGRFERSSVQEGSERSSVHGGSARSSIQGGSERPGIPGAPERSSVQEAPERSSVQGGSARSSFQVSSERPGIQGAPERSSVQEVSERSTAQGASARSSIQGSSERSSIQGSGVEEFKRHSVGDIIINGKTNFEKTIQSFEFADSDMKDEKIENVAKKNEKSGESSDSDVEVRKKPVKPPKPERPVTRPTSGNRNSNEIVDVVPSESAVGKEGRPESAVSNDAKVPIPVPRPGSQPIPKPRSGSGESTDF